MRSTRRQLPILALLLAAFVCLSTGAVRAGMSGPGVSGIQVQNLEIEHAADITVEFYDFSGSLALSIVRRDVPPGGAANFYLPSIPELRDGAYAMVLRAERSDGSGAARIAAINRTDWPQSGGAAMYADVPPGEEVYVPLVVKQTGLQSSIVSIQNTDVQASADLEVELYGAGGAAPVATYQMSLPPAGSVVFDLAKSASFASLPDDFVGAMRIVADRPVGAMSFLDIESSDMAVSAFEGVPSSDAASRLHAPLIRNAYFGTTGISVVNPGAEAVDVEVTYRGNEVAGNACDSRERVHNGGQPVSIAAHSSAVFYQGGPTPESGDPGLPAQCFGSALIEVVGEGAVMAIVNDFTVGAGGQALTASAYNAVPETKGSTRLNVPLVRNAHTADRLSTGLQVVNLGESDSVVALTVRDNDNREVPGGADRQVTLAPGSSHTWYLPAVSGVVDRPGMYGAAVVTGTQPLAAIVSDVSETGTVDNVTFNAIPSPASGALGLLGGRGGEGIRTNTPARLYLPVPIAPAQRSTMGR